MRELTGDLWTTIADFRIIPTNGVVTAQGTAVMGVGVAAQAVMRYPFLPRDLGTKLRKGNHVYFFDQYHLITFPTKEHFKLSSSPDIIERSVEELQRYLIPRLRYVMPRCGCGAGGLNYQRDVRPLLLELPDNVSVVTRHGQS